jgi:hypothetical protein
MSQDFFKEMWEVIHPDILGIMQEMHTTSEITKTQTHGMLVCIPKKQVPIRPEDYRILTLLNADIKLLARIISNRLDQWLPSVIHQDQHCGIRGRTILDAVATVRGAIAHAEYTKQALCILSLEFQTAFDNVSHQYLFNILEL